MATSQNGWTAPPPRRRTWVVPGTDRHFILRDGPAGLILLHFILWWHERIEPITGGVWDEWGTADRNIRGSETDLSNHASGTAADINATQHPLGVRGTLAKAWHYTRIRARLLLYKGCLRWGGDYTTRADEMHVEINRGFAPVRRLAIRLARTPRGIRILEANPEAVRTLRMNNKQLRRFLLYLTKQRGLARRALDVLLSRAAS